MSDPAQVDRRDRGEQQQRPEHDLDVEELVQVVAAEGARERARRGDARTDHREGDDEREEAALERMWV